MPRILNKISAIFTMRCPRCEKGKLFTSSLFDFKNFIDMPQKCSHCELNFMPEPGFYMGSMFISYAVFSWGMLGMIAVFYMVFHISINMSIFLAILGGLISFTYVIRLARSVAIHMVRGYDAKYK